MSIKKAIAFLLALKIAISGLAYTQDTWNEFKSYVDQMEKKYLSKTELHYRFTIFADRKAAIEKFNSEDHSYKKGVNIFTDLTLEERKSVFGAVKLDRIENYRKDLIKPAESPFKSNQTDGERRLQDTDGLDSINPRILDWDDEGKVTPPKYQGYCGSSYAFASAAQIESYYLMSQNANYDLSEQQLVDCTFIPFIGNSACSGGTNTISYVYVILRGITYESAYPYKDHLGLCNFWKTDRLYIDNAYYVPLQSFNVFIYNLSLVPIASSFYAPDALLDYYSGIFDAETHCSEGLDPNYSALAVGYSLIIGNRYIRFKGNWGDRWGENGFFNMSFVYEDNQNGPCNLTSHEDNVYFY